MGVSGGVSFGVGVGLVLVVLAGCSSKESPAQVSTDPLGRELDDAGVSLDAGPLIRELVDAGGATGRATVRDAAAEVDSACQTDRLVACVGESGCSGTRTCSAETGVLSACSCAATQSFLGDIAVGVGAPTSSVNDPEEPTGELSGGLGDGCQSDSECVTGLGCLQAGSYDYFGFGGPAGGYCTTRCSGSDVCDGFQPGARCQRDPNDPTTGLCMRDCTTQAPAPGENKCFNRPDVVCNSLAAIGQQTFIGIRQDGFCRPLCASDAECPGDRVCHSSGGMCVDAQDAATGLEIGAFCSVNGDCKSSFCDEVAQGLRVCSQLCVLGESGGCGFSESAESRSASCLTARVQASRFSEGEGDLGVCREVCRIDEDCQHSGEGWTCQGLSEAAAEFFAVPGACVPPAAVSSAVGE